MVLLCVSRNILIQDFLSIRSWSSIESLGQTCLCYWVMHLIRLVVLQWHCSYASTEQTFQDEIEYWKSRAARLTLLTEQMMGNECKMTVVTLRWWRCWRCLWTGLLKTTMALTMIICSLFRAGKCKLLKVWHDIDVRVAGYFVEVIDSNGFILCCRILCRGNSLSCHLTNDNHNDHEMETSIMMCFNVWFTL